MLNGKRTCEILHQQKCYSLDQFYEREEELLRQIRQGLLLEEVKRERDRAAEELVEITTKSSYAPINTDNKRKNMQSRKHVVSWHIFLQHSSIMIMYSFVYNCDHCFRLPLNYGTDRQERMLVCDKSPLL